MKKCSGTDDEYEQNSINLRNYQNILNKTIREAKFHYYQNQFFKHKNNMRRQWSTLGTLLNKRRKDNFPNAFLINNEKVTDYSKISNAFNKYYKDICANMREPANSRSERDKYLKNVNNIAFNFSLINVEDVKRYLII